MSTPVWSLSINLETKTATFQSGMADAARAARGSFDEIKSGAATMGRETSGSMTEARHGVMLLGEEFGIHLPRGITSFLASLGPVAAAMEAAFPFLAIIVGATLLLEHLAKLKEANSKIGSEWDSIEASATKAFSKMSDELVRVEMESDRLAGRNLAALHKQLELIDHQTLGELESAFDELASKIDATLKAASRGSMMTMFLGEGASDKVKAEFDKFKAQYDALLSQHNDAGARGALVDEIIHAQEQLKKYQAMPQTNSWVRQSASDYAQLITQLENVNRLQDESTELDAKKKANATTQAQDAHPEDFNPELFVEAQNKKRVSLAETIELVKKQQKVTDDAAKLELEGMEGLSKGLKELADERAKSAEEAGKENAGHTSKMAQLQLEADKEAGRLLVTRRKEAAQQMMEADQAAAQREYEIQMNAYSNEITALDKHGKDYENKLRALQDRQTELTKAHENQITLIKDKAEQERNASILGAEAHMRDALANGLTQVLMRHETFAQMSIRLGDQIAAGMMETALKSIMALNMTKEHEAAAAARQGWLAGMKFPFPANIAMAPTLAAMGFASVMAFEEGGIVPGVGIGDTVPARLTPGEAVLPKRMTEDLQHAAKFGGDSDRPHVHVHHHATYHVQAFNRDGVKQVLRDHGDAFIRHATDHLRKMNR